MPCPSLLRFLCGALLLVCGCESEPEPRPVSRGHVAPGPAAVPQQGPFAAGNVPAEMPGAAPADSAQAPPRAIAPGASLPIRLSAGTALPQTGPDGTLMSFSIDFLAGGYQPQGSARCVLVIERGDRQRIEQAAHVSASGTWTVIVPGWQPESGPFQARVEEIDGAGIRRALSAAVLLQ